MKQVEIRAIDLRFGSRDAPALASRFFRKKAELTARLEVEVNQGALVLTLSNPAVRNALSPDIYPPLLAALERAGTDARITSVILTGAGGFFSAGGDLRRLKANRKEPRLVQEMSIDRLHAMIAAVMACEKPVIAAVEGAAAGAGYSLALACDLIVAARSAKFVMAYVGVGLSPDGGGSWQILRTLPKQLAMEQLLTGAPVAAERLYQVGAISQIAEDGGALDAALALARRLDRLSPVAVKAGKRLARGAENRTLCEHMDHERQSFVNCLHGPEAGEAIDAFLEKRQPRFGHDSHD
jgi:enoyl-CoA hydratase/carnithine racemase